MPATLIGHIVHQFIIPFVTLYLVYKLSQKVFLARVLIFGSLIGAEE